MMSLDPYDVWSSSLVGKLKQAWYSRKPIAAFLPAIVAMDWLAPLMLRRFLSVRPNTFPHVEAMHFLSTTDGDAKTALVHFFSSVRTNHKGWGLPFKWYSKNGVYGEATPYITNTPYVMEALLKIAEEDECRDEAMSLFHDTWQFLESLKVLVQEGEKLALSYAPVDEPRIVVNANSYAAFAYALHAVYGRDEIRATAQDKAMRLAHWVVGAQEASGRWWYYADHEPGNFIDGFHSCFVVKNLIKVKRLLPETSAIVDGAIGKGWRFIRAELYDRKVGLCRRFAVRSHRDPYRWDLYDQAEYLGLLVDFGLLDEARQFSERVEQKFKKGAHWYCRIDILGRRWGRDFLRWGIVPFWYQRARLSRALEGGL